MARQGPGPVCEKAQRQGSPLLIDLWEAGSVRWPDDMVGLGRQTAPANSGALLLLQRKRTRRLFCENRPCGRGAIRVTIVFRVGGADGPIRDAMADPRLEYGLSSQLLAPGA